MIDAIIFIGREQYEEPQFKRGGSATLYFLTDTLLGKFIGNGGRGTLRNDSRARQMLQKEANIAQYLYENAAPIARPYGVHDIGLHYTIRGTDRRVVERYPCFVQDFEDFPALDELDYNLRVEGMVLAKKAVRYLKEKTGLIWGRDILSERNILFSPERREVRLVDFSEWIFEGMKF